MPYINDIRQRGITRWYLGNYHDDNGTIYEIHFSKSYNVEDDSEQRNLIYTLIEEGEIQPGLSGMEWNKKEIQKLPLK